MENQKNSGRDEPQITLKAEPEIRTGTENMDLAFVHDFLSTQTYWAKGIPLEFVRRSMSNSFCVGVFIKDEQVAFGRLITDYSTFGWLADVFVVPGHRDKGFSKMILSYLGEQSWYTSLRRVMLNTKDAHGLYQQFGFGKLTNPGFLQEIYRPGIHSQTAVI